MDETQVRQVLLDAIADAAKNLPGGTGRAEGVRHLAEAWTLLTQLPPVGEEEMPEVQVSDVQIPRRIR